MRVPLRSVLRAVGLVLAGAVIAGPLWLAAGVTVPYTFSNAQVADAAHVNANFEALRAKVAEHDTFLGGCGGTSTDPGFSCRTIRKHCGVTASGLRWAHFGRDQSVPVWCDMETGPGGWTLLLSYDHKLDQIPGSPNPLALDWNPTAPAETTNYGRNWNLIIPNHVITGGSEIMLKRIPNGATQRFTVTRWVGWDVDCDEWDAHCGYSNKMNMYAEVKHPSYTQTYYFHACNGPECHGTDTYEAVGVDCHAPYTANYTHTANNLPDYVNENFQNCPPGRDPDLWGFGASATPANRQGSWGKEINAIDLGRVAYFFRE